MRFIVASQPASNTIMGLWVAQGVHTMETVLGAIDQAGPRRRRGAWPIGRYLTRLGDARAVAKATNFKKRNSPGTADEQPGVGLDGLQAIGRIDLYHATAADGDPASDLRKGDA